MIASYTNATVRESDSINSPRMLFAMTRWRLGQQDRARELLSETLPAVDEELQSFQRPWNRRVTLELLRNEAEAMIGPGGK